MKTNGSIIHVGEDAGQEYLYRVICEEGDDSWVQALNGHYKGERLTFKTKDLHEPRQTTPS